ncbi:hypothetical protein Zmor_008335 [Zophobas morio]|uniref:Acyl-CoA dehydrogenase/oxidase N-terminal domain-containing protein n=1 Tax=Zophobas morio TaxID=2755281 RepID=A0AA38IYL4_9CUCU|nr:hypothetical protein Zmor_008335 [Zophobas morio]
MTQFLRVLGRRAPQRALSFNVVHQNGYNFDLNETQKEFQAVARKFAREESAPVAAYHDKTAEYPSEIFKKAWSLGLVNLRIPKHCGGLEESLFNSCLVVEELFWGCSGIATAVSSAGLGVTPLVFAGTKDQQKKFLPRLLEEPLTTVGSNYNEIYVLTKFLP